MALENAGFQLPQRERITLNRLFSNSALHLDLSTLQMPENPLQYPRIRYSKSIRHSNSGPSSKQLLNINSAKAMQASILKVTMVPQPGFGCIITLQSKPPSIDYVYQLTISSYPNCTCSTFKEMMSKFGMRGVAFKYCKHLYYIFVMVCTPDLKLDLFIHAPTFSFNEIKLVLKSGILTTSTL